MMAIRFDRGRFHPGAKRELAATHEPGRGPTQDTSPSTARRRRPARGLDADGRDYRVAFADVFRADGRLRAAVRASQAQRPAAACVPGRQDRRCRTAQELIAVLYRSRLQRSMRELVASGEATQHDHQLVTHLTIPLDAEGIDNRRYRQCECSGVAGNSAGGNIATVLCIMAKQRGDVNFVQQSMYYPMTDAVTNEESESYT